MLTVELRLPLDGFDLDLALSMSEHVTGVFGPSGSGKTSLLESIAGLRRAEGRIVFNQEIWLDSRKGIFVPPEARRLGYVPQDGLLFSHLDVRGNLLSAAVFKSAKEGTAEERLESVCALLELEPLLEREVQSLSGGERQRVALGRAVCSDPKLLLLDEPLGSLDFPLRRRILPFLRQLRDELAIPMVFVSHDPIEVLALCDELAVVERGRLVARGVPADLLTDPRIYALADQESFENVLQGIVLGDEEGGDGSRIGLGENVTLRVPSVAAAVGSGVLVTIPAQQILIAIDLPAGLSARNYLPATITSIRSAANLRLVSARLDASLPDLVAEVTQAACAELSLDCGKEVFLVIKTTGCKVI